MIKSKDGRTWSERTVEEDIALLKEEFQQLSADERQTFLSAISELGDPALKSKLDADTNGGPIRILDAINDNEYIRPLVDMETFVYDPYYLGATCGTLYPKLLEDLREMFRGGYRELILSGAIGTGKCVAGDTVIFDAKTGRRRRVDELGELQVPSMDSNGKIVNASAIAMKSGRKRCYELKLRNGSSVKLSADHKVFTSRGWVMALDLLPNDLIAVPRIIPDPKVFYDIADDEIKLIAYLMSDGGCTGSTTFTNANNIIHEEFRSLVMLVGDGAKYDKYHKYITPGVREVKWQNAGKATTVSATGIRWLVNKYNCNVKAVNKQLPIELYGLSKSKISIFLNRFIACDGEISVKRRLIEIGLGSECLIDDLRFLMLRLGVTTRKAYKRSSIKQKDGTIKYFDSWRITIAEADNVLRLLDAIGDVIGKEYQCRELRSIFSTLRRGGNTDYDGKYRWLAESDLGWEMIKSNSDIGEQDVYDLSVDGTHNFIGNNIVLHNTFVGSIVLCRILYELSCLRNIHRTIGLAPHSDVTLVGISVNEQLAIRVVYENVTVKVAQSPYFKEHFPFQETKKELRFPNNVLVAALSTTDTAALGRNVIGGLMDEGNFFEAIQRGKAAQAKFGDRDKARVLYDQLVRRMKSRFLNNGKMPGMMIIVSSKRTKDDFTAKRISESHNDPTVYITDYRTWELVPDRFSKERFQVLSGNETLPSRILTADEVPGIREMIAASGDESLVVLDVPTDYRVDFEADLDGALRDIGGLSTVSVSPFIQQRDKIEKCIDPNRLHPFQVEEWDQTKPGSFIWERLAHKTKIRDGAEIFEAHQPLFHPQCSRHIHIDMSLNTDCTGICMGCVIGFAQVERKNRDTGEKYIETSPVVWIDFMLRIKPPTGGEIDHGQVRGLVYQLQAHGFNIGLITMDQAHSASSMQIFRQKGISVERLSVDRPIDPYDILKTAIYEGRVNMYRYAPILDELRKLQKDHIKQKVDHPRGGKKDVADSMAGIVFSLTTNAHHAPLMPLKGISQYSDPEIEKDRQSIQSDDFFPPFLVG